MEVNMTERPDLRQVLARYREAAECTSIEDAETANRWHDKLHSYYKQLRETAEGRAGISGLLVDPSPHVRLWAAAHSLKWETRSARETLEALRDSKGFRSFEAEMTLEQF